MINVKEKLNLRYEYPDLVPVALDLGIHIDYKVQTPHPVHVRKYFKRTIERTLRVPLRNSLLLIE